MSKPTSAPELNRPRSLKIFREEQPYLSPGFQNVALMAKLVLERGSSSGSTFSRQLTPQIQADIREGKKSWRTVCAFQK